MQRFDENTLQGAYILNLLYNYYLPKIRVLSDGSSDPDDDVKLVEKTFTPFTGELYIYKNAVRKHTSAGDKFDPNEDEFLHAYIPGLSYDNLTDNFMSNVNYYNSDIHERLGEYLRFYRDYYHINLMSLYNCFSNRYIDKFSLPIKDAVGAEKDITKKLIVVPVKFGKKYKIYCESSTSYNTLLLGFYDNNKLLNRQPTLNDLYNPRLSFKVPNVFEVKPASNAEEQSFEKYLHMFIQIPESVSSSIVIIEVDSIINDFCLNPSLLIKNYFSQHAFSDRLFEFLIGNVITPNDEIIQNIVNVQKIISSNKFAELYGRQFTDYNLGEFDDKMHKFIYNTFRETKVHYESENQELIRDFTGYIDKDIEDLIMRAQGKPSKLYDRS